MSRKRKRSPRNSDRAISSTPAAFNVTYVSKSFFPTSRRVPSTAMAAISPKSVVLTVFIALVLDLLGKYDRPGLRSVEYLPDSAQSQPSHYLCRSFRDSSTSTPSKNPMIRLPCWHAPWRSSDTPEGVLHHSHREPTPRAV